MSSCYLITAGPTHEPIDAVRYIANRSSGAMGVAIAQAARDAGCPVTLLLGPTTVKPPEGVRVERFESAADLAQLLDKHFRECDVLVMAAAVADYRPIAQQAGKIERRAGKLTIELESTPDLVAACAARRRADQYIVGFALAAADQLAERAVEKLRRKSLDAIIANPLNTMGAADIEATVYTSDGKAYTPPTKQMDKPTFARWLVEWIAQQAK